MRDGLRARVTRTVATVAVTAAVSAAAIAAAGASVLAQDAPKRSVDLRTSDRWETGEVFTVTERQTLDMEMTMSRAGAEPVAQKLSKRTESVVVWRCLEAGTDGAPKRALAWIRSYEDSGRQGKPETSAAGAFVEATPGKWRILSERSPWSAAARNWFEKKLALGSRSNAPMLEELDVPESLTVGETLKFGGTQLAKAFGQLPSGVDPSKIVMTLCLDSLEDGPRGPVARMTVGISGDFAGEMKPGAGGPNLNIVEGSSLRGGGRGHAVVGGSHRDQEFTADADLKVLISGEGVEAAAEGRIRMEKRCVPGGEMPEPTKTPGAPAPGVPPAPPTPR